MIAGLNHWDPPSQDTRTTELFTPTFAVGRVAGWTAHCLEQQRANRLMRPESAYVGPGPRPWMPIKNRHEPAGGA
jgi:citrate synthase